MYLKRGGKEIMNWRSAESGGRRAEGRGQRANGGAQRAKAAQPPTAISAAANRAAAHREAIRRSRLRLSFAHARNSRRGWDRGRARYVLHRICDGRSEEH